MNVSSGVKSHITDLWENKRHCKALGIQTVIQNVNHLHTLYFSKIVPLCTDWVTTLLGPSVCKPLALLINDTLFSKLVVLVYSFIILDESSYSSTFYQHLILSDWYIFANMIGKMVSHYSFICIFQITSKTENLIIYLTVICVSSFGKYLLMSFVHRSIWIFCLSLSWFLWILYLPELSY